MTTPHSLVNQVRRYFFTIDYVIEKENYGPFKSFGDMADYFDSHFAVTYGLFEEAISKNNAKVKWQTIIEV